MKPDPNHYLILQKGLSSHVIDALTERFGEENIIPASMGKFPGGAEFVENHPFSRNDFAKNHEKIQGSIVTIVQSTGEPCAENLFYAKLAAENAKRAGAKIVQGVFPFQEYMRQEKDELNINRFSSMANQLVVKELAMAGFDYVSLVTPHSQEGIDQYKEIFGNNFSYVQATDVYAEYFKQKYGASMENLVIGAPDGMDKPNDQGQKRAEDIAKALFGDNYAEHMFAIQKTRRGPGVSEITGFRGEVQGKIAVIIDDMIDSGGTMVHAAEELKKRGAIEVDASAVHGIFSKGLPEILRHRDINDRFFVDKAIVSNTLPVERKIDEAKFELPGVNKRVEIIDISKHLVKEIEQMVQKQALVIAESQKVRKNLSSLLSFGRVI